MVINRIYVNNDILDIVDYLRLAKRNNILNNNEFQYLLIMNIKNYIY